MRNDHRKASVVLLVAVTALLAGCATTHRPTSGVRAVQVQHCIPGRLYPVGSATRAFVAAAPSGATAVRAPGGSTIAKFGDKNQNGYPTVFGVTGAVVSENCAPTWYRVELPMRPNGSTGYIAVNAIELHAIATRIVVDVSERKLTLYRAGRPLMTTEVAVGSSATPTPTGRYYVNQRLVPDDPRGPFGPAAIGVSAFSNVLTGWAQGGPIAIHGTNEPWSIGKAVSNGCVRVQNATLERLFRYAVAGTPVIINR
jgi:lipoprotein-anchoring transpeptidase ErfK/SrfK